MAGLACSTASPTTVDPQQLAELREVQRLIRLARRDTAEEFTWCRATPTSSSAARTVSDAETELPAGNLTPVVRGICTAIADGELQAGDSISSTSYRSTIGCLHRSVIHALAQLAEEYSDPDTRGPGASRPFRVPTPRDVIETYTARGLLGTAITRGRPPVESHCRPLVDEHFAGSSAATNSGAPTEACRNRLELQDELAVGGDHAPDRIDVHPPHPPIATLCHDFRLNYRYPTDEIVADDQRILVESGATIRTEPSAPGAAKSTTARAHAHPSPPDRVTGPHSYAWRPDRVPASTTVPRVFWTQTAIAVNTVPAHRRLPSTSDVDGASPPDDAGDSLMSAAAASGAISLEGIS